MSHKGGRKSHTSTLAEEKDKRSDSPVKEMKKKLAANAEKEKQISEKSVSSTEKSDKHEEKVQQKSQNEKTDTKKVTTEKVAPIPDKTTPKPDKSTPKPEKITEKADKNAEKDKAADKSDKKTDKVADKNVEKPVEKKNEPEKKDDGKGESKDKPEKPKQNGSNGDSNGITVSDDSSEEELVIDDQDEQFPELAYDESSDADYEEGAPSRSFTRRSQVKATKTPETPRPASVKEDDSKEKVLKMNDSLATDRKLRSADSPKHEIKKTTEQKKAQESPKKDKTIDLTEDEPIKNQEIERDECGRKESYKKESDKEGEKTAGKNKLEMEVVVEIEGIDESRSRTRARVSPFTTRPAAAAKHDQTTSSLMANYTGNNTTMEMDITESSSVLEEAALDDSYLRGLRTIKGRSSYKPLGELALKHTLNRSTRSNASANSSLLDTARPTGTVVGRKRKPDAEMDAGGAAEPETEPAVEGNDLLYTHNKRMRLLDRFSVPFRGFSNSRTAEIVGINTDLPLTAPVASTSSFDPETLKPSQVTEPLTTAQDRDSKRCAIM